MSEAPAHREEVVVHALYPAARGSVTLRGNGPDLDWHRDLKPVRVEGDVSTSRFSVVNGHVVELKLVRDDGRWMAGRNVVAGCGDELTLHPAFEGEQPPLENWRTVRIASGEMRFRVQ